MADVQEQDLDEASQPQHIEQDALMISESEEVPQQEIIIDDIRTKDELGELVSDVDNVFCEYDSVLAAWVLCNITTQERHILLDKDAANIVFVSSSAVLRTVTCEEEDYTPTESIFKLLAYRGTDGTIRIKDTVSSRKYKLVDELRDYTGIKVNFVFGDNQKEVKYDVAHCRCARWCGQHLVWNAHQLYNVLGLKTYRGERWTWVSKRHKAWIDKIRQVFPEDMDGGYLGAQQTDKSIDKEGDA